MHVGNVLNGLACTHMHDHRLHTFALILAWVATSLPNRIPANGKTNLVGPVPTPMVHFALCGTTSESCLKQDLSSDRIQLSPLESKSHPTYHQHGCTELVVDHGRLGGDQDCGSLVDCLAL